MALHIHHNHPGRELLSALDERYTQFVDSLPTILRDTASSEGTYVGHPTPNELGSITSFNPLITCTPWLFWETFAGLERSKFLTLAEAGLCLALSSVLMDHIVDGQANVLGEVAMLQNVLYDRSVSLFRDTSGISPRFWSHFDRLHTMYVSALSLEVAAQSNPADFTEDRFIFSAGGKVAPMVATVAAFLDVLDSIELLEAIESSFQYSYIAGQIHDDILDWQTDLASGHITYFILQMYAPSKWNSAVHPSLTELTKANHEKWIDVEGFSIVLEWFDRAIKAVQGVQCEPWHQYLADYRQIAEDHQKAAVARHLLVSLAPIGEKK